MSSNYITEGDLSFQNDNSALEEKTDDIVNFTSSVLLDLSDEDIAIIKDVEGIFELLKSSLFSNSDTILRSE